MTSRRDRAANVVNVENERRRRGAVPSPMPKPFALAALAKHDDTAALFFQGLHLHYFECVATGRLDDWRKCAIACVDLMASLPDVQFVKRNEVGR